jgi:replication factor A1
LRKNTSTIEYLAFLSLKYNVDPDRLFSALVQAGQSKNASCGDLSIMRRGETRDKIMFLIVTSSKLVAQLLVLKEFLLQDNHSIRDFMETAKIRRFWAERASQRSVFAIRDLRSGMTRIRLKAKVLEIPKPNPVYTRYGDYASVASALIADETGTIRLCLWNEQLNCVSVGDTIQIENATARIFKGQRQLNIGRKGTVSIVNESTHQMKEAISS